MTKKLAIVLCLVFSPFLVKAEVVKFVFTSDSQAVKVNTISEIITVQAQDSAGKLPQTACIHLQTTSSTGQFSSNNINWEPISSLTMSKNTANKNFYYKDSSPGEYVLTVKFAPTTCATWTSEQWSAQQSIVVSDSQQVDNSAGVDSTVSPGYQTPKGEDLQEEPRIFAKAGPDRIVIAGADEKFSGSAIGLEDEPLKGARYLWSFGDGSIGEGVNILHCYKYPGEYVVVLDVSSGEYAASDRLIVKAIPNQVKISEANSEYIKIFNGSASEINISNWLFKTSDNHFRIPETTIIRAKSDLIVPSAISGIKINGKNDVVNLLYPNLSIAYAHDDMGGDPPVVGKTIKEKSASSGIVVSKDPDVENLKPSNNLASVIYSEEEKGESFGGLLLPTVGVGLLAAIGYVFVQRQRQKENSIPNKSGDDFVIDDDF